MEDIYDRIITAWPHLRILATRARDGEISARNTLANNVLSAAAKPPLTAQDIWTISDWLPAARRYR